MSLNIQSIGKKSKNDKKNIYIGVNPNKKSIMLSWKSNKLINELND